MINSHQSNKPFQLDNRVFLITGGARGLGLNLVEALVEVGAHVHCLDRLATPAPEFYETQQRVDQFGVGSLQYRHVEVQNAAKLNAAVAEIAAECRRLMASWPWRACNI